MNSLIPTFHEQFASSSRKRKIIYATVVREVSILNFKIIFRMSTLFPNEVLECEPKTLNNLFILIPFNLSHKNFRDKIPIMPIFEIKFL